MARVKRILLEWTTSYEVALNTGIQRVVRNIVNESKQIGKELKIKCQPIVIKGRRLLAISKIGNRRSPRTVIRSFLKDAYRRIRPVLNLIPHFDKIEGFLFRTAGLLGLITIIRIVIAILLFPVELTLYLQKQLTPKKGDLLLLLDSSWVYPVWPAVRRAKANGACVGLVVYDIIPVTHPQLMTLSLKQRFQAWFKQATEHSDFFIAISKTVRNEVETYVRSNRPSVYKPALFESFTLGSVIDNVNNVGEVREELKTLFGSGDTANTYLMVGTIEPRKNHKYLIDAFDMIWQDCPDVRVCIVGRLGWFYTEFLKRIKNHPSYNRNLFMFNDLSDTELNYCYNHAKALVFPSLLEGFGLPIVEALHYKLPVLVSDIPIFHEVGRDFCAYFDVRDPASLAKMVMSIEKDGKMPEVRDPDEYQLPDWKDSCRELLSKAVVLGEKVSI